MRRRVGGIVALGGSLWRSLCRFVLERPCGSWYLGCRFSLWQACWPAQARKPHPKPTDVPATVIAHLPLPQATGSQMLLQRENGKHYLYVQQAAKQGFMVVDVSNPEKPSLLKRTAESNQATSGNLEIVGPDVAIAEAPEKTPTTLTSSNHPTEVVRVLDLSDPHESQDAGDIQQSHQPSSGRRPQPDLPHQRRRLVDSALQSSDASGAGQEKAALRFKCRNHGHAPRLRLRSSRAVRPASKGLGAPCSPCRWF